MTMTGLTEKILVLGTWIKTNARTILIVVAAFAFGFIFKWATATAPVPEQAEHVHAGESVEAKQIWTCSMHPQIRLGKPGLCPICNMELIRVPSGEPEQATDMRRLTVSESAARLMDIEVAPVERKFVAAMVRMVGKVDYDETNLAYITAWVPGRLDRLYVDYTGIPVNKGDHMVWLYSPELIGAQEELLQAIRSVADMRQTKLSVMRQMAQSTVEAAREKLRLWGLTAKQITEIESTGQVSDHMTIYAPTSGIVIHKNAIEGMYVETGTRIYTIADLSKIWVKLDAYESDLEWIRYGQEIEFTTVSYSGEIFRGTISFIDPILNDRTRTVKVRVNVANPDGKLKPGMFVKAIVRSQVAVGGRVMDADLAGKWICPMHPEIIKTTSGRCDICQMPLVRTETLGYVSDDPALVEKPLVIPASAPLITGTRAIVYIQIRDTEKPTYEGREITLGPRAGDYYIVRGGLAEGELVVVKGNFKIDSSLQIMAKPSMMTPEEAGDQTHRHGPAVSGSGSAVAEARISGEFRVQLSKVFDSYFAMQQALSDDKAGLAAKSANKALEALNAVDMKLLSGRHHDKWMDFSSELEAILAKASRKKNIKLLREDFYLLSQQLTEVAKHFGSTADGPFYLLHCPMAFDNRGAGWLQNQSRVGNPYFGHRMLRCGAVKEVITIKKLWEKKDR